MAAKKVGTLIREARTAKKLSQEQLAATVDGLSGSDIGKAERGEKELSQAQLKAIAKTLGITQKSLLEAPKGGTPAPAAAKTSTAAKKTTEAKKTTTAKTSSAAKTTTAAKTSTAKKTATTSKTGTAAAKKTSTASKAGTTTAAKKPAASKGLTAAEEKFLDLYRGADADARKLATRILKGENLELGDVMSMMMKPGSSGSTGSSGSSADDGLLGALLGKLQGMMK